MHTREELIQELLNQYNKAFFYCIKHYDNKLLDIVTVLQAIIYFLKVLNMLF